MLIFLVFLSCFLYPLSSGQTTMNTNVPMLGSVYTVPNNSSLLNFTFIYPTNYQFDNLYVRFMIYDFVQNDTTNPQPYSFSWLNFTNSNFSLPWVAPPLVLSASDYIIACFEWVQTNMTGELVSDTNECVLSRIPLNNSLIVIDNHNASSFILTNTTAMMTTYFPKALPYDQVNVTCTLNDTILPSMTNSTNNDTYSSINTFTFMNLTANICYNICTQFSYANSRISGSQEMDYQCQLFMIPGGNSVNKILPNMTLFILLIILAFI